MVMPRRRALQSSHTSCTRRRASGVIPAAPPAMRASDTCMIAVCGRNDTSNVYNPGCDHGTMVLLPPRHVRRAPAMRDNVACALAVCEHTPTLSERCCDALGASEDEVQAAAQQLKMRQLKLASALTYVSNPLAVKKQRDAKDWHMLCPIPENIHCKGNEWHLLRRRARQRRLQQTPQLRHLRLSTFNAVLNHLHCNNAAATSAARRTFTLLHEPVSRAFIVCFIRVCIGMRGACLVR